MADYYELLGLARDAPAEEVKRAYRRLARQHHPDLNPGDSAAEDRFKEVTRAYEVLSDPEKRRRYDTHGEAGVSGQAGAQGPFGFGGFADVMDFFGSEMFGGEGFGGRGQRRGRGRRGADLGMRARLTFEEAVFGVTRQVRLRRQVVCEHCAGVGAEPGTQPSSCRRCGGSGQQQVLRQSLLGQIVTTSPCPACQGSGEEILTPCRECRGQGRVQGEVDLTLDVPPGVESGMRIRYPGRGDGGQYGGASGDLYVELEVAEHPLLERDGNDLLCRVAIPVTVAALGGTVTVESLDGPQSVTVAPGTQTGTVERLKRLGVPHRDGHGRGDLLVELAVTTPQDLNEEQRVLLRRLAELRGEEIHEPEHLGFLARLRGSGR